MCADFLWKKAPQLPPSSHHPQSWKLPSQILNLNVINQTSPPHPYLLHPKIRPHQAKATDVLSKLQNATTPRGRLPGTYPSPFTFQSPLSQPLEGHQLPDKPPLYKYLPTQCPFCFTPPGPRHSHLRRPNPHHEHSPYPSPHKSPRHAKHTMSCHTHTIPIPLPI